MVARYEVHPPNGLAATQFGIVDKETRSYVQKKGRIIRFRKYEEAQARADELNKKEGYDDGRSQDL